MTTYIGWGFSDVWLYIEDSPPGSERRKEIQAALENSDIVLGILSSSANNSKPTIREWDWTDEHEKPLCFLRIENVKAPYPHTGSTYIDFTQNIENGFTQLQAYLSKLSSIRENQYQIEEIQQNKNFKKWFLLIGLISVIFLLGYFVSQNNRDSAKDNSSKIIYENNRVKVTELGVFSGHSGYIYNLSFSPDGKLGVVASEYGAVDVFDFEETGIEGQINVQGYAVAATVAPDNRWIAISDLAPPGFEYETSIILWDIETGQRVVLSETQERILSLKFSPDNEYLLAGNASGGIEIWDLKTRTLTKTLTGHLGTVRSIKFSPNGLILVSSSSDGTIRLWNFETFEQVNILELDEGFVGNVSFSKDGKYLLGVKSNRVEDVVNSSVYIWSIPFWESENILSLQDILITDAEFTSNDELIIFKAETEERIFTAIWDTSIPLEAQSSQYYLIQSADNTFNHSLVDINDKGDRIILSTSRERISLWAIEYKN